MTGYYAVIFTSKRTSLDQPGYDETASRMVTLAAQQPGYLGIDDARSEDGVGITVSYWKDLESIRQWREHSEHAVAQSMGRDKWYEWFHMRICRMEHEWSYQRPTPEQSE